MKEVSDPSKKPNKIGGFTIVELLIVIVIIGILAALVIVAYRGIQQRANNAQTISVVTDNIKAIKQYAADNGKYPELSSTTQDWSCLGTGYPGGACLYSSGAVCTVGSIGSSSWYNDAVKTYTQNKTPPTSLQKVAACSGGSYVGAGYLSNNPTIGQATIVYYLNSNDCGSPAGQSAITWYATDPGTKVCLIQLDKP